MNTTRNLRPFHDAVDAFMTSAEKRFSAVGRKPACAAGCAACCFEPVYAERAEAEYLLQDMPEDTRAALALRVAEWWLRFEEEGLMGITPPEPEDFRGLLRYRSARLPCPLLADDHCDVYATRPFGCRTHTALGHRQRCEVDRERPMQQFIRLQPQAHGHFFSILMGAAPAFFFQFDHLGIWLGHLLLGKTTRSAAGHDYFVRQTAHSTQPGAGLDFTAPHESEMLRR